MQTFLNLPSELEAAVARILSRSNMRAVAARAEMLHDKYMSPDLADPQAIVRNPDDVAAYLALRFPATYAQVAGALAQVKERVPDWQPKTMLDMGCGPGTAMWAAAGLWPSLANVRGIDQVGYFLSVAEELRYAYRPNLAVTWDKQAILRYLEDDDGTTYDLIVVANVLNELPGGLKNRLVEKLAKQCTGLLLILEPGTEHGFMLVERFAKALTGIMPLVAPYVGKAFVPTDGYWVHFAQRFQRPAFLRAVRQSMRHSPLMASDWEEATYSYVAAGNIPVTVPVWGVVIGKVEKYKGYLIVPVLTASGMERVRVMKRHKEAYATAKELRWGEMIPTPLPTEGTITQET